MWLDRIKELKKEKILCGAILANKYVFDGSRLYKEKDKVGEELLGELFDRLLPEMLLKRTYTIEMIKKFYPIIAYEYDLDCKPIKKIGDLELVEKYLSSTGNDRLAYLAIIRHRLDSTYNKDTTKRAEMILKYITKNEIKDEALLYSINQERILELNISEIKKTIKRSARYTPTFINNEFDDIYILKDYNLLRILSIHLQRY